MTVFLAAKGIMSSLNSYRRIEFPSDFGQAKMAEDRIVKEAIAGGYDDEAVFAIQLSLEEAFSNAIRHGNNRNRKRKVSVRYRVNPEQVDIYIGDEGAGFDPNSVPDPTTEENIANPSGRGIMLMRAYMNRVEYNDIGNEVHLVKMNKAR